MPRFLTYRDVMAGAGSCGPRGMLPFRQAVTMRILSGEAHSQDFVDLDSCYTVVAIDMPDAWTAANIGFMTAPPSLGLPDSQATPVALTAFKLINEPDSTDYLEIEVAAGEVTYIQPGTLSGFRFLRLVSMTDGALVAQAATREIILYVRPV